MNSTASNAEVRRLQYLQAMGVTSYYPRLQVPGALPSQACEWPFADKAESVAPAAAAVVTASRQEPVPHAAAMQRETAAEQATAPRRTAWQGAEQALTAESPARPASAPVAAPLSRQAAGVHPGEELHFQLLLMPVDADLTVVLQIPALSRPQLQDRQRLLLGNMLRWLGKALPVEYVPRIFRWPLPGLTLTNTRREAGASLLHFLEQACVEQPFRELLMLGEAAAECLQAQQEQAQPQGRTWQITTTHSLDELLALPQLKRAAWQALLPLHAALVSPGPQV